VNSWTKKGYRNLQSKPDTDILPILANKKVLTCANSTDNH